MGRGLNIEGELAPARGSPVAIFGVAHCRDVVDGRKVGGCRCEAPPQTRQTRPPQRVLPPRMPPQGNPLLPARTLITNRSRAEPAKTQTVSPGRGCVEHQGCCPHKRSPLCPCATQQAQAALGNKENYGHDHRDLNIVLRSSETCRLAPSSLPQPGLVEQQALNSKLPQRSVLRGEIATVLVAAA